MLSTHKIGFIGAGSMAEAMISGMLANNLLSPSQITVSNRGDMERLEYLQREYGILYALDKKAMVRESTIIVLAMKPKDVVAAIEEIKEATRPDQLFISVLAGISTTFLSDLLGHHAPVIRTMPNTSSAVGLSATAMAPGKFAGQEHLMLAETMFRAIGMVAHVDEQDLHAVTGISGSGPAYVYYLVEAMEQAAGQVGLKPDVARELILQTIIGAAHMLKNTPHPPSVLRQQVTSPGGTTEAGIRVLEQYDFQEAVIACIKRATERSKELGELLTETKK